MGSTDAPSFVRARATASVRKVVRDDGAPVAGATILVSPNLQDGLVVEGRADETGHWELPGLAPGTVDVEASFGGMSSANETGFHLVAGASVDVRLTLARLGSLEGTVVTADGLGVAAQVALRGKYDQFPERQARADTNGRFSFSDLPRGDVVVRASLGADDSGATVGAKAEAGKVTKVSLSLPARFELRVELDRAACKALEGVTLRAFEPDATHPGIETVVPSNAQFTVLKLRAGTWTLRAASGMPTACSGQTEVTLNW